MALAAAAPERGTAALAQFTGSRIWQLRMYAARAAAMLKDRDALETLASDDDDNVREAAVEGLRKRRRPRRPTPSTSPALTRSGNQMRARAALALEGTPIRGRRGAGAEGRVAAARRAKGSDNSHDARDAIARTLASLGADRAATLERALDGTRTTISNADDLRRLASPRARITIRGVGTFELALFTAQAPATVLRFARLAEPATTTA